MFRVAAGSPSPAGRWRRTPQPENDAIRQPPPSCTLAFARMRGGGDGDSPRESERAPTHGCEGPRELQDQSTDDHRRVAKQCQACTPGAQLIQRAPDRRHRVGTCIERPHLQLGAGVESVSCSRDLPACCAGRKAATGTGAARCAVGRVADQAAPRVGVSHRTLIIDWRSCVGVRSCLANLLTCGVGVRSCLANLLDLYENGSGFAKQDLIPDRGIFWAAISGPLLPFDCVSCQEGVVDSGKLDRSQPSARLNSCRELVGPKSFRFASCPDAQTVRGFQRD